MITIYYYNNSQKFKVGDVAESALVTFRTILDLDNSLFNDWSLREIFVREGRYKIQNEETVINLSLAKQNDDGTKSITLFGAVKNSKAASDKILSTEEAYNIIDSLENIISQIDDIKDTVENQITSIKNMVNITDDDVNYANEIGA